MIKDPKRGWRTHARRIIRAYGEVPAVQLSAHEGHQPLDDAELCLHELAHIVFVNDKLGYSLPIGGMDFMFDEVSDYIRELPRDQRDLEEIKALAVEMIVASRLELPINTHGIFTFAASDTEEYSSRRLYLGRQKSYSQFVEAVTVASTTSEIVEAAEKIMRLVTVLVLDKRRHTNWW